MSRATNFWLPSGRALQTRVGRRVFMLFVACAMLPVTVLGVASYLNVADSLRDQASERERLSAKRMGSALFERFDDLQSSLTLSVAALNSDSPARSMASIAWDRRFVAVAVISEGSRENLRGVLPAVPALSPRQLRHLESGGTILTVSPDTTSAILMARRIPSGEKSSRAIWAQVSNDVVERALGADASNTLPGLSCIVLPDGTLLRCPGFEGIRDAVVAATLGSEPAGTFSWVSGDERQLAAFWSLFLGAKFATNDWRIVYSEPEAEILAPLTRFSRTFALTSVLALLIVGFLSTGQIRRSLGPLTALREGTERVRRLEFDRPVDVTSGDEFEELAGAFNDMSQALARSSEELRERQARLGAILDAAADAIVTVNADRRIESFNKTAERVFGLRESDIVGRPLNDLFAMPLETELVEVVARRNDGSTFPTEVSFAEARVGDRSISTVFVRDISERKRAAEDRERLEAQLRQAHKLETLGTLAGGIAHDFNNILTPIIGHVDLALTETVAPSIHDDLEQVRIAAMRAKDLVRQILLFSRRSERVFSPIDVGAIITEALKLLRSSLPTTVELRSSIAPDVARVLGDPTQLHQVLMNLCANASQAMGADGGVLEVRLDMTEQTRLASGVLSGGDMNRAVRLIVCDTGRGMDAPTMERLFEPFFTTKPVGEGTGLGMSIVHGIIADHGGTITVESTVDAGTTFEILLPPTAAEAVVQRVARIPSAPGEGRILVVDDDAVIARLVAKMLERVGYDVMQVTSPAQVPEMLATAEPPFDLLISDQTMPGMTGLQLARRIQKWQPGFPMIMTTGYLDLAGPQDPRELGLRAILVKPVEFAVLVAAVGRVLDEHRADMNALLIA